MKSPIIAAVEAMTAAFHAKDLTRVMASYEPHASIAFAPGEPTTDPAAQREAFEGFFALSPTFVYGGHEVLQVDDLALHIAPWTMTGTAPDGTLVEQRGLSVAVLRKQPDGRWLLVLDDPFGDHLLTKR